MSFWLEKLKANVLISSHDIHMMSTWLIIADADLDHVNVVSAVFLHRKVFLFHSPCSVFWP